MNKRDFKLRLSGTIGMLCIRGILLLAVCPVLLRCFLRELYCLEMALTLMMSEFSKGKERKMSGTGFRFIAQPGIDEG